MVFFLIRYYVVNFEQDYNLFIYITTYVLNKKHFVTYKYVFIIFCFIIILLHFKLITVKTITLGLF